MINHFRILPTDERYQRLSERQKLFLFYGWLEHPTPEDVHKMYEKTKGNEQTKFGDEEIKALKKQGMSDTELDRLVDTLKNAGLA